MYSTNVLRPVGAGEGWNGGTALWEDVPECTQNSTVLVANCSGKAAPDCAWPANSFPDGLKSFHRTVGEDKTIWVHAGLWTSGRSAYTEEGGRLVEKRSSFRNVSVKSAPICICICIPLTVFDRLEQVVLTGRSIRSLAARRAKRHRRKGRCGTRFF